MKKVLLFLGWMLLFTSIANAQVPQGIPYQAVARNGQGQPLASTNVKVRFSILDSTATGTAVYVESHSTTTSALGLFTANVGMGTSSTGTFSSINWGQNFKFLKVELDTTATGNSYIDLGTQQMMSVPYALYAGSLTDQNQISASSGKGLVLDSIIPFDVYGNSNAPTLVAQLTLKAGQSVRIDGTLIGCGQCGGGGASVLIQTLIGELSTNYNSNLFIPNDGWNITPSKTGFIYLRASIPSVVNISFLPLGNNSYGQFKGVLIY